MAPLICMIILIFGFWLCVTINMWIISHVTADEYAAFISTLADPFPHLELKAGLRAFPAVMF